MKKTLTGWLLVIVISGCINRPDPKAVKLLLPKEDGKTAVITDTGKIFTVVLSSKDELVYYEGSFRPHLAIKTNFKELSDILGTKRKAAGGTFVVIIKTAPEATHQLTVDMLDQMFIHDVKRYALVDITQEEIDFLKKTKN